MIPPLSNAPVRSRNIPHVTAVEAYKGHIPENYKALYEKCYLEYYATELGDLWLEKSAFALDEQEVQQWHDAMVRCQEEEAIFHDFVRLENYEGEAEEHGSERKKLSAPLFYFQA